MTASRVIGISLIVGVIGVAAAVYAVKYESSRKHRQVAELTRQIERERESIATLRAEWSALNQPSRLQSLAERHLRHLRPQTVAQLALAHEIPDRPLDLGLFIEQLSTRGALPALPADVGSPTGATRTPVPVPLPAARPRN